MNYPEDKIREELAKKYICGSGIEIGALCHPLNTDADVKYIDRFDLGGLHEQYADISVDQMHPVDIVDDGEKLESIASDSQDFVIANHFLEHCEFPIDTVQNWVRVLKPEGVIFCAVPDKELTFDKDRGITPLQHLADEYANSTSDTYAHYMDSTHGDAMLAGSLMDMKYSIHYHVWDRKGIEEFFEWICHLFPLELETHEYNLPRAETIFILRKK